MLPRTLETEAMDTAAEARDYDDMDHAAVNRVFVADFLAVYRGTGRVLDVGTGTARIPVELCRQAPHLTVVAIDLAAHMLAIGRENVSRAGLADRVTLERVDAKAMPYPSSAFAAVVSNSILHHIPEPGVAIGEMLRVLAPGGFLFVRDLLRPEDDATVKRLVDTYAADATPHQRQMFDDSFHAALTLAEVRALVADRGSDPANVTQTSDRHWTWSLAPFSAV